MGSAIISQGLTTIKPTAYLEGKPKGDSSMLLKRNEVITRITKRFLKVNDSGIKLDCLKTRSMPVPSSRMSYRVIGHMKNSTKQVLRFVENPILQQRSN